MIFNSGRGEPACTHYLASASKTACGLYVGGLYFNELSVRSECVTCEFCLKDSDKFPLYDLAKTEL